MTIRNFVPDLILAKMADALRVELSAIVVTAAPADSGAADAAAAAAQAATDAAAGAALALRPGLFRLAADASLRAAQLAAGTVAIGAKHWTVSSLPSNWEQFKKDNPTAGENFGGLLLVSELGLPASEKAPPSWHAQLRARLRMAMPVVRRTGYETDLEAVAYVAACRAAVVDCITRNRRWGYNNVFISGLSDWNKVEDSDPNLSVHDLTGNVQFSYTVTPTSG
jgi:hypothetical protein